MKRKKHNTDIILIFVLVGMVLLSGCRSKDPIIIGFIGGTSGSVADLGISGLDAIQMAVRVQNEQGGIKGRRIQLETRDDLQDPVIAQRVARELIDAGAQAIIGPMTSDMAVAILPILNEAQVVAVSPTATTERLSGKDDYFFRVTATAGNYATLSAEYQLESGHMSHVAVALDRGNWSFSRNWLDVFEAVFTSGGGEIVKAVPFSAGSDTPFFEVAEALLDAEPDGILLIANSMDSALLCQQIRKLNEHIRITLSDWGATERLLELGGKAIDGVTVVQAFARENTHPAYQAFRNGFIETYRREPGFPGVNSFNASQVVFAALESKKTGESLAEVILSIREFEGLQGPLIFDAYGEIELFSTTIGIVRDGQIHVLD